MAGAGRAVGRYVDTDTPIFVFHGSDDNVVGPSGDRAAARQLAKTDHDFIYTELDGIGHGFPASIQKDLFDFFDARRLAVMRGKRPQPPTGEVDSSFLGKVSREEKRFLGDPTEYGESGGGGSEEWKALVKDLKLGGGKAVAAADHLIELKDEDSVKPLSDLLRHPKTPDDVKNQAARALGGIGNPEAYKGLLAGLNSENHAVFTSSAEAMAAVKAPKSGEALINSFGHLDQVLESKRLSGNQMHISDWDRWLPAYGAVVRGLAELAPEGAAAAIARSPVKRVIAEKWDVLYSARVGQTPRPTLVALVKVMAAALQKLGATAELAQMKKACGEDAELAGLCG
jgi:HEAT repeat protein